MLSRIFIDRPIFAWVLAIIVMLGAALIGWVGGGTVASDRVLQDVVEANLGLHYIAAAIGAFFVVFVGRWLQRRHSSAT